MCQGDLPSVPKSVQGVERAALPPDPPSSAAAPHGGGLATTTAATAAAAASGNICPQWVRRHAPPAYEWVY
jgi:hypothetical protein